ncbi:probable G-protein coupled receptor B0563.6 [Daphnia carinata]|uniref:probable G-protein coupled receptor B0563.6 n=1 Tax=Daphnia carinata TaxID=120202 RepID=UPI00257CDE84|nr:probable G-protein coupled receptor B0563.6 [Daphnia carinata]
MIIMDQSAEEIFNLSLSEIVIKCPPEISNYFMGAALTRLNQMPLFGEDDSALLTRQQLNQTDHFLVTDSSGVSDWPSTVLTGLVSSVPTPVGILRNHQHSINTAKQQEDMQRLKYYSYGIALPAICILGILGNVLNLIVLTRPSMRGPAYVYMRGYAGAALLAIVFALPFSSRILFHNEVGPWKSFAQAFFHTHLELFLGNACLGIGVLMLVALTVERYLAVCRLGRTRAFAAKKTPLVAVGLALLAVSLYLPYLFRAHVITCSTVPDGLPVYRKRENPSFAHSTLWAAYLWTLEVIFKMAPTLIIVHLNCCIIVVYRRTCARRRSMLTKAPTASQLLPPPSSVQSANGSHHQSGSSPTMVTSVNRDGAVSFVSNNGSDRICSENPPQQQQSRLPNGQQADDSRRYWEEKRLMFLLGSTSILFSVCITPQLVLSLMIHEAVLQSYYFQVFRAVANILEVTNYSFTFYIYCMFSRDFRATLLQTLRISRPSGTPHQTCL